MAKKRRRTAFVPRLLLRTAIAGVIPACALGCSSSDSSPSAGEDSGTADAGYGDTRFAVADTAYPDVRAVADAAYGDTGVADVAYPDSGTTDAPDASDTSG